ncbi:O-antigen ligase family protein, partial [Patescibacteria group bacterium]|nr:O-antigen ligase family protein [Patescibacteria group bacterium]
MFLIAILLYFIISILNLRLASLILIVLLPSYLLRFQINFLPTTFLEIMIGVISLVWFIQKIIPSTRDKNLVKSFEECKEKVGVSFLFILGLFILTASIAVFVSPEIKSALGVWKAYFIEPIILFFIFLDIFSKKDISKILFALTLSATLVSGLAILQKFTGWFVPYTFWGKDDTFRVTSFYGFPNAISLYLAPIIPFFFYNIYYLFKNTQKNWFKITLNILVIFSSFLTIIWAKSTGALVALLSGFLLINLFRKKTFFLILLIILIIFSSIYFELLPKNVLDALLFKDWSGQVRLKMWVESVEMLKNNFIFGAGLSGYQTLIVPYHVWDFVEIFQYPHNVFLNFWSEIGLLGLISFIALIFIFYRKIFTNIKLQKNNFLNFALAWSMAIILIHGLVDVPYFKNDLAILFWLIFVILFLSDNNDIKEK